MNDNMLNIAATVERSDIYGPGTRFVIWVQGCNIRCKGCWNTEMQSMEINQLFKVENIFKKIIKTSGIEGVTILGGEPLHQSKALLKLVKKLKNKGLTVMLYTGFEEDQIKDYESKILIELSDIAIIGRYLDESRSTDLKWRGSTNQKVIFNNEEYETRFGEEKNENQVEVHIDEKGEILLIGYPPKELRKEVIK